MKWTDAGGGGDFEPAPAGTHVARCYQIIDLGTHHNEMFDNERHQVFVGFELSAEEPRKWKDKDGNEKSGPVSVGKFYTMSLNEKANLRADLESWRGRPFTETELAGFDPKNILGAPAILSVIHEEKKGKKKAVIASVAKMMKGMECPKAINPPIMFSLTEFNQGEFDKVPKGFQAIIRKSKEWAEMGWESGATEKLVDVGKDEFVDDDIPF